MRGVPMQGFVAFACGVQDEGLLFSGGLPLGDAVEGCEGLLLAHVE